MKPVRDIKIKENQTVKDLVEQMHESGGFMAKNLAVSVDILKEFVKEKDCLKFLSFPADIISTGTRGIIKEMVKNKMFDVLITTCGTLDHDLARSFKDYYQGSFSLDDKELYKKQMHRLGNVVIPIDSYGVIIEEKIKKFLGGIIKDKKDISTHELCWEIGKRINNEDSILYWAWKNKIPMIIPGITDGSVGYNIWEMAQGNGTSKVKVAKQYQCLVHQFMFIYLALKINILLILWQEHTLDLVFHQKDKEKKS